MKFIETFLINSKKIVPLIFILVLNSLFVVPGLAQDQDDSIPTVPLNSTANLVAGAAIVEGASDHWISQYYDILSADSASFVHIDSPVIIRNRSENFLDETPVSILQLLSAAEPTDHRGLPLWNSLATKPGAGFIGSALIPGLSQAAGGQYWKSAIYLAVEAATIYLVIDGNNRGRRLERQYIQEGNNNWSVIKYAAWVHNYYHNVPGARSPGSPDIDIRSLLTEEGLQEYYRQGQFPSPTFDIGREWNWINLPALRDLERRALYLTSGRPFSHDVPDFGSQQYYELMSKYFQFGPGWRDWNDTVHNVNDGIRGMSPMWLSHARLEERFNDSFRMAGNMLTLMVVNHIVSAFDAYFTIKLRNHRLESGLVLTPEAARYQLTWHF